MEIINMMAKSKGSIEPNHELSPTQLEKEHFGPWMMASSYAKRNLQKSQGQVSTRKKGNSTSSLTTKNGDYENIGNFSGSRFMSLIVVEDQENQHPVFLEKDISVTNQKIRDIPTPLLGVAFSAQKAQGTSNSNNTSTRKAKGKFVISLGCKTSNSPVQVMISQTVLERPSQPSQETSSVIFKPLEPSKPETSVLPNGAMDCDATGRETTLDQSVDCLRRPQIKTLLP
ncbi:hypothetical protein ACH5RR_004655 [Cinchona calisaya]|uniref:Uncharacterized protein n=1 Tax=Cinchona calisaya TaxID=153742 RepID=A0ABD3AZ04_9GENT